MNTTANTYIQNFKNVLELVQRGPFFSFDAYDPNTVPHSALKDKLDYYDGYNITVTHPAFNMWFSWEVIDILLSYLRYKNFSGKPTSVSLGSTVTTLENHKVNTLLTLDTNAWNSDAILPTLQNNTSCITDKLTLYRYTSIPLVLSGFETEDLVDFQGANGLGLNKAKVFGNQASLPLPNIHQELPGIQHNSYLFSTAITAAYNNVSGSLPGFYDVKHLNITKMTNKLIQFYEWFITGVAPDASALAFHPNYAISPTDLLCLETDKSARATEQLVILLTYNTLTLLLHNHYFAHYILEDIDSSNQDNPFVYFTPGASTDFKNVWLGDIANTPVTITDHHADYLPVFLSIVFNSQENIKTMLEVKSDGTTSLDALSGKLLSYRIMDNILTNFLYMIEIYESQLGQGGFSVFDVTYDTTGKLLPPESDSLNDMTLSYFDISYDLQTLDQNNLPSMFLGNLGPGTNANVSNSWNLYDLSQGKGSNAATIMKGSDFDISGTLQYPVRRTTGSIDSAVSLGLYVLSMYQRIYHSNIDPTVTGTLEKYIPDNTTAQFFTLQDYYYTAWESKWSDPYSTLKSSTQAYAQYKQRIHDTMLFLYDVAYDIVSAAPLEAGVDSVNTYMHAYTVTFLDPEHLPSPDLPLESCRWFTVLFRRGEPFPNNPYPHFALGEVVFGVMTQYLINKEDKGVESDYTVLLHNSFGKDWTQSLENTVNDLQTALSNYVPSVVQTTYLLNNELPSAYALADHNHDTLYLKPEEVTDIYYLVTLNDDGSIKKKYTPEDFALVGHTHSQYYKKDATVDNADALIDADGNIYTAQSFAKKTHTHPQYLQKGSPAWGAYKLDGHEPADFALADHNHDALYLKKTDIAAAAWNLQGNPANAFAAANHTHDDLYYPKSVMDSLFLRRDRLKQGVSSIASTTAVNFIAIKTGDMQLAPGETKTVSIQDDSTGMSGYIYGAHTTLIGDNTHMAHPYYEISQDGTSITFRESTSKYRTQFFYLIIYDIRSKQILKLQGG